MKISTLVSGILLFAFTIPVYATSPTVIPGSYNPDSLQKRLLDSEELTIEEGNERDTLPLFSNFIDSLSMFPAYELYNYSWSHERLNPYRVKIDSLPDSILIKCPDFVYPTKSNLVTSKFGPRRSRYHYGIDLGIQMYDTIYASFSGRVRIVDYERKGYGHYVVIRHDNGLETVSAHLSRVFVKNNQVLKAGEALGLGGSTGRSTGPHLHYEIRFLGNAFNPIKLIDFENRKVITDSYLLTKKETYSHKREMDAVAQAASQAAYYKVKSGDTLSRIAHRYGTSVQKLCKLNRLRETSILQIGQRIRYR